MKPPVQSEEKSRRHIFIIGNGVIAKALAIALTLSGRNVTILRGTAEVEAAYSENIQVETGGRTLEADILISSINNFEKLDGVILLTNKSFGNTELAKKLKSRTNRSPIVFLQNGLHIENSFIKQDFPELYRCVLLATSQSVTKNKVTFKLVAPSPVGVIKGSDEILNSIVETLSTDIFSFRAEADIQTFIWKKVISNCVFNSICPLLETDNGVFQRNNDVLKIAKTVISECLAVAHENGIMLTEDEVLQNVLSISKMSDGQKISTYQDILNKRETEIDTLNFAIAKAALLTKIEVPVTSLLGDLVKIKSELSRS